MNQNKKRKLPPGLRWEKLGDVCFINPARRKGFFREPTAQTSFVPMEAVDELTGRITKNITRSYSEISNGYTFFEEGDVLFAKITPCMQNGKSAIAKNLIDGIGFGSTEFHVLRPKPGVVKEWIYYFVRTREFRKRAEENFEGSAGQKRVPVDFIENFLIPLPHTIIDQVAIANELEHKMAKIQEMREAALRQKDAISAMQGAILREVFPYKEGDKLPEGWKWEKLKKLGSLAQGGTPSTDIPEYWQGNIPFITGADVINLYVSKARSFLTEKGLDSGKTQKCEKGDLLIVSRTGVGRIGIAGTTLGISQDVSVLKVHNGYDVKYLAMFLKSISRRLEGARQGATIKGLIRDYIENILIPIPPTTDAQISIANVLERKMAKIEKMREAVDRQLGAVGALSGAILREAFDFEN